MVIAAVARDESEAVKRRSQHRSVPGSSTIGLANSVPRAFGAPLVRNSKSTWTGCGVLLARRSSARTVGSAGSIYEFMEMHPESDAVSATGRVMLRSTASVDCMMFPLLLLCRGNL